MRRSEQSDVDAIEVVVKAHVRDRVYVDNPISDADERELHWAAAVVPPRSAIPRDERSSLARVSIIGPGDL